MKISKKYGLCKCGHHKIKHFHIDSECQVKDCNCKQFIRKEEK